MNARSQLLESHTAFDIASLSYETIWTTQSTNTRRRACDPAPRTSAAAQAHTSEGGSVLHLPPTNGRLGPLPPDTRLAGPDIWVPGPRFAEHPTMLLEERHRLDKMRHLPDIRKGIRAETSHFQEQQDMLVRAKQREDCQFDKV